MPAKVEIPKEDLEGAIAEKLTSSELADRFGVTQATITKRVKEHFGKGLREARKNVYEKYKVHGTCKTCGGALKANQKAYCSNECKFADDNYNASRAKSRKSPENEVAICKKCGWTSEDANNTSGALTVHADEKHGGEASFKTREVDVLKCPECGWTTTDSRNRGGAFTNHVRQKHPGANFKESHPRYAELLPDNRSVSEADGITCRVCGETFKRITNTHLSKHGITPEEYKNRFGVTRLEGDGTLRRLKQHMHQLNQSGKMGVDGDSSLEKAFESLIDEPYEKKVSVSGYEFDFRLSERDVLVEVDGSQFHPRNARALTFTELNTAANDAVKNEVAGDKLVRIRAEKANDIESFSSVDACLNALSYEQDFSVERSDVIVPGAYTEDFAQEKGSEKLREYARIATRFLQKLSDDVPVPEPRRDIYEVVSEIRTYDYDKTRADQGFKNNVWAIGNRLLKSRFGSFWQSSFAGKKSPAEAWKDTDALANALYSNVLEKFRDVTLNEAVKALKKARYAVSFMKPLVAASVYDHFLGDARGPKVLDPCAGFGARMLAFTALYPRGTYVGVERNPKTAAELRELAEELPGNTEIINKRFQDTDLPSDHDLAFTSPPYPDTETYSDGGRLRDWDGFLEGLRDIDHLVVKIRSDMVGGARETWPLEKGGGYMSEASEEVVARLT